MTTNHHNFAKLQNQVQEERKLVSSDNYDITVQQLIDMFEAGSIIIPPEYQRQFVWDAKRESELVESIFLGIPIPNLFMATNKDATWEVVDGVQRLCSLAHFKGTPETIKKINRNGPLEITELEKLTELRGIQFSTLPGPLQLMFSTRPIRITVLNDKSDLSVRFDLFERLNTGGVLLSDQEIRNCVFRGDFNNDIKSLVKNPDFLAVVKVKTNDTKNGMLEELVLRFFAYLDKYNEFDHSVKDFLNGYMQARKDEGLSKEEKIIFEKTFSFLRRELPNGITRGRKITPINLYEAISVGVGLCFKQNKTPKAGVINNHMVSEEIKSLTTGATNSKARVSGRINSVYMVIA
ncbi:DUF262 domain-containing protein [Aeromonas caviae]|uniref:DUF262 domain-containing protein n=1 Tax=Aeromonas caviae TaxID=648 RepID=UPI002B465F9F|nr:DUF262 domain-containing protein [Aeromonas caviae]